MENKEMFAGTLQNDTLKLTERYTVNLYSNSVIYVYVYRSYCGRSNRSDTCSNTGSNINLQMAEERGWRIHSGPAEGFRLRWTHTQTGRSWVFFFVKTFENQCLFFMVMVPWGMTVILALNANMFGVVRWWYSYIYDKEMKDILHLTTTQLPIFYKAYVIGLCLIRPLLRTVWLCTENDWSPFFMEDIFEM